jgi:hypothetical protein
MSDFAAIRAISESLRALITAQVTVPGVTVSEQSPRQLALAGTNGISVWLYRVTRNEHLQNHPPRRPTANQLDRQSMPINLHYLISFMMTGVLDEQLLLGRVLQLFSDQPVLRGSDLVGSLAGESDEFRIHFEALTLEELTRIWASLQEPYRTSVSYVVEVIRLDSAREPQLSPPVMIRESTTSQILKTTP